MELINTPEFQRLRRIRQLGVSNITYPGAEHTRFSHSLGVMNFAGRILDRLEQRYSDEEEIVRLIRVNRKTVKAAALLHDTGHAPFSHMMERAFKVTSDHEARTGKIITDRSSHIPKILTNNGIVPKKVKSIIAGTFPLAFLHDIVSSQLDADRMDYLLRDSMMTGVEYGNYDAEWIINALCLGLDPASGNDASPNALRLCLEQTRGLHAAEQLVVARMHMSHQVYYHRVTRGWEAHLLCLFAEAERCATEGHGFPRGTPRVVSTFFGNNGALNHKQFLEFDEAMMLAAMRAWANTKKPEFEWLSSLAVAFLNRRKIFHSVQDGERSHLEDSFQEILKLKDEGAKEKRDYYHDEAKFRGYKDFGRSISRRSEGDGAGSDAIFLASGNPSDRATPVELVKESLITKAMANRDEADPLNRVFFHEKFKMVFLKSQA